MDSSRVMRSCWLLSVAFLVALVMQLFIAAPVHAQNGQYGSCNVPVSETTCTRQEAYSQCAAQGPSRISQFLIDWRCQVSGTQYILQMQHRTSGWLTQSDMGSWSWREECPAGSFWNDGTNQCDCGPGSIIGPNGQCKTCSSFNSEPGFLNAGPSTRNFQSACIGGCTFAASGPSVCSTLNGSMTCSGVYEFTGDSCTVPTNPEPGLPQTPPDLLPAPEKTCFPAEANQTMCVKKNGDHCTSTRAGKEICWKPGETGDKTSGPEIQSRRPGTDTSPPTDKPKPPETLKPPYNTITTTTTIVNNNNTTTTVTTTTTSRETTNGTNAGDRDDASNSDGSDGDGDGDGDGAGESGDCNVPPKCTLGESIGCAMLRQSWTNHCAGLKGADSPEVGDFSDLNDKIPGLDSALQDVWSSGGDESDGPPTLDDLDQGWAGRGSCPIELSFSVPRFGSYTMDGYWLCYLLDALAWLVTVIGTLHAGWILLSGFRKGG